MANTKSLYELKQAGYKKRTLTPLQMQITTCEIKSKRQNGATQTALI